MSDQVISHYRILRKLGRGGMGEVYLAEDTKLERRVAIKVLPEELQRDEMARKRLLREAKAAAALDHPYICHIHEAEETDGKLFIVMEYVEGQTLKDRLARGPLPLKEALQAVVEIAEALEKAHEKGIVHRDLKPSNIMVARDGHVKVMDFGLAKQLVRPESGDTQETTLTTLTREGATPGTLAYMSPEQARAKPVDARSDIFSFGIVTYEMLTGVHPFKRATGVETVSAILSETPLPLGRHAPESPERLQHVVGKMLAKEPDQRYQSVHEIRTDVQQILQEREAAAPAAPRPGIRGLRRPILALVTVVALVILAASGAWWIRQHYFRSPAAALAFQERDWILITDFKNTTGDPVFDGSLETAMTVSIQQSRYVNVFPRTRVRDTLKRMRKEDTGRLDENLGREVALREGIKGLLVCSIDKIGNDYLLSARLVDPDTEVAVYSESSQAVGKDQVLAALDALAEKVRRQLGESLLKITSQRVPLPRATTSSLEALKSFAESRRASGQTAIQLLEHAVELDPDFACAHADLGYAYYVSNRRPTGELHFKKAMSLLDRLTVREKLYIRALVEDWRGNRDQGIENYKTYLAEYPDDPRAWFRLGYTYMITKRYAPAVEAFKKVIEIEPSNGGVYANLATCYRSMGEDEQAAADYEKAFQLSPEMVTYANVNNEYGFLLVKMGMIQKARETFEKMLAVDDAGVRAGGHRSLALLNTYLGKYSAAAKDLREAILITKASGLKLNEMRNHLYLASVFHTKGAVRGFEKEIAEARRLQEEVSAEPYFLYVTGRMYARTGRLREASQLLHDLSARLGDVAAASSLDRSNRGDQANHHLLEGEVELLQKHYGKALESFGIAAKLNEEVSQEPLAYGYLRSGNLDAAIREYEKFLGVGSLGFERQELWILAHYQLGRIYEEKGQREKAADYYRQFLNIWKDADEDLEAPKDARRRLSALG